MAQREMGSGRGREVSSTREAERRRRAAVVLQRAARRYLCAGYVVL